MAYYIFQSTFSYVTLRDFDLVYFTFIVKPRKYIIFFCSHFCIWLSGLLILFTLILLRDLGGCWCFISVFHRWPWELLILFTLLLLYDIEGVSSFSHFIYDLEGFWSCSICLYCMILQASDLFQFSFSYFLLSFSCPSSLLHGLYSVFNLAFHTWCFLFFNFCSISFCIIQRNREGLRFSFSIHLFLWLIWARLPLFQLNVHALFWWLLFFMFALHSFNIPSHLLPMLCYAWWIYSCFLSFNSFFLTLFFLLSLFHVHHLASSFYLMYPYSKLFHIFSFFYWNISLSLLFNFPYFLA